MDPTEYLDEIRRRVCRHCPERPPGGPPCLPLGKECGVELHLPALIRAIREVHSGLLEPYVENNRARICTECLLHHGSRCPCPMDFLSELIVEAVEEVEERRELWELVRSRLTHRARPRRVPVAEMCRDYEEATGTCIGCD
jgi:hypothetical protein